jgi:D-alanyl-D-alanine carboxypeptidase/D-alanyl-D-alanine-endopeptidase (penicillin-binding protein 4)
LKDFLKGTRLEGKLAMKTGSLNGVQCYAGYKLGENSNPSHVVVIMVNHYFCSKSEIIAAIAQMLLKTF